ncbi:MAG: BlaI/MecI/CopY family transcriptional regulator [Acidobacteria bacterium]|nr:BlaI/MecI/CopY family transcriptional regulator [Acidobacteriota bacterium]
MLRKFLGGRWSTLSGDPVETVFGVLERDVMDVLWRDADLPVRDVQTRLRREVAYTTVMTTLDRLYKKGVLLRRPSGRAFLYSAALTRAQLRAQIAGRVLTGLLQSRDGAAAPVLSNLVDSVGSQEGGADLLAALEEMVRDKRRQLKKDKGR